MEKEELLEELKESREKTLGLLDDLPDEALEEPGVLGNWSIKDILAHLTSWEAELIKLLWQASQGQKPSSAHFSGRTVDQLNAQWFKENKNRPLERVLADFTAVRKQTLRRLENFSNKDLNNPDRFLWLKGKPLWEWVAEDTFRHEEEHRGQIRRWKSRRGMSNGSG